MASFETALAKSNARIKQLQAQSLNSAAQIRMLQSGGRHTPSQAAFIKLQVAINDHLSKADAGSIESSQGKSILDAFEESFNAISPETVTQGQIKQLGELVSTLMSMVPDVQDAADRDALSIIFEETRKSLGSSIVKDISKTQKQAEAGARAYHASVQKERQRTKGTGVGRGAVRGASNSAFSSGGAIHRATTGFAGALTKNNPLAMAAAGGVSRITGGLVGAATGGVSAAAAAIKNIVSSQKTNEKNILLLQHKALKLIADKELAQKKQQNAKYIGDTGGRSRRHGFGDEVDEDGSSGSSYRSPRGGSGSKTGSRLGDLTAVFDKHMTEIVQEIKKLQGGGAVSSAHGAATRSFGGTATGASGDVYSLLHESIETHKIERIDDVKWQGGVLEALEGIKAAVDGHGGSSKISNTSKSSGFGAFMPGLIGTVGALLLNALTGGQISKWITGLKAFKKMKAMFEEGTKAFGEMFKVAKEKIMSVASKVGDFFGEIRSKLGGVGEFVGGVFAEAWDSFSGKTMNAIDGIANFFKNLKLPQIHLPDAVSSVIVKGKSLVHEGVAVAKSVGGSIAKGYKAASSAVGTAAGVAKNVVSSVGSKTYKAVSELIGRAASIGSNGIKGAMSIAEAALKIPGIKGILRVLGKLALPLTAILAGYDAYKTYQKTKDIGQAAATFAISGLGFGIPDLIDLLTGQKNGSTQDEAAAWLASFFGDKGGIANNASSASQQVAQIPAAAPVAAPSNIGSSNSNATAAATKGFNVNATVGDALDAAAKEVGVDRGLLYAMARQESGFNASAKAGSSSAKGLFQFTKGTWGDIVRTYGKKYPILSAGPNNPKASAIAGALYIKENKAVLEKQGIHVDGTSLYAAHFLGPGGAVKLYKASDVLPAAAILPAAAASNPNIFKPGATVADVKQFLFKHVGSKVGGTQMAGSEGVASLSPTGGALVMPSAAAAASGESSGLLSKLGSMFMGGAANSLQGVNEGILGMFANAEAGQDRATGLGALSNNAVFGTGVKGVGNFAKAFGSLAMSSKVGKMIKASANIEDLKAKNSVAAAKSAKQTAANSAAIPMMSAQNPPQPQLPIIIQRDDDTLQWVRKKNFVLQST